MYLFVIDVSSGVDGDGMHNNVNVIDIDDDDNNAIKKKINPAADVKNFFKPLPPEANANTKKKYSACKTCTFVFFLLSLSNVLC